MIFIKSRRVGYILWGGRANSSQNTSDSIFVSFFFLNHSDTQRRLHLLPTFMIFYYHLESRLVYINRILMLLIFLLAFCSSQISPFGAADAAIRIRKWYFFFFHLMRARRLSFLTFFYNLIFYHPNEKSNNIKYTHSKRARSMSENEITE